MAFGVKHQFQSQKSDGQDASLLQPSYWNEDHVITMPANTLMGRSADSEGDAEPLEVEGLLLEDSKLKNPAAGAAGAEVVIAAASPTNLPNARVATDSDSVVWDKTVAQQIKAEIAPNGVLPAHMELGARGEILVYGVGGVPQRLAVGVAGQVLVSGGAGADVAWATAGGAPHAVLQCRRASGTDDGGTLANQYVLRTINTELYDVLNCVELGAGGDANKFKFIAGTYVVSWSAPTYGAVGKHQSRLRQLDDGETVASGSSSSCAASASTLSNGLVRFDPDPTKWYGIQHRAVNAVATNGFGEGSGFGETELYTQVNIWKVG